MSDSSPDGSREGSFDCFNGASAVDTGALPNLRVMENNDQIKELQTIIRDKYVRPFLQSVLACLKPLNSMICVWFYRETTRSDFLFYSNRLVSRMYVRARVYVPVRTMWCDGVHCYTELTIHTDTTGGGGRSKLSTIICTQSHHSYRWSWIYL